MFKLKYACLLPCILLGAGGYVEKKMSGHVLFVLTCWDLQLEFLFNRHDVLCHPSYSTYVFPAQNLKYHRIIAIVSCKYTSLVAQKKRTSVF